MKKSPYFLNMLLILTVGTVCMAGLLIQAFAPAVILPRVTIPLLVLLSLIPLVIEYYLGINGTAPWVSRILLAGAAFALLPWCAGLQVGVPLWKMFLAGASVFGVTAMLYKSIGRRMASGPKAVFSPVIQAFCLYLASQCLQGLL